MKYLKILLGGIAYLPIVIIVFLITCEKRFVYLKNLGEYRKGSKKRFGQCIKRGVTGDVYQVGILDSNEKPRPDFLMIGEFTKIYFDFFNSHEVAGKRQ